MKNRCLYCYKVLNTGMDFHSKCSSSFFGTKQAPNIPYTMDEMSTLAKEVVERSVAVPGVQAKLSMSLIEDMQETSDTRLTVVGALGGNYTFKPPSIDFPEMPANEHVTMRIAKAFGIRVVPSSLIKLASGEISYITKRIDRSPNGEKIHMIDMFQITEAFDKYKSSMEKVGKALDSFSENTLLDKLFYFELAVFSFLTGNNDMHLKNFSMINTNQGWSLAPAYDLLNVTIVNPEDKEELALTLQGKKKKLKKQHFDALAHGLKLTTVQIDRVYKRMIKNKAKAHEWISNSFLSNEMQTEYNNLLNSRYRQLELI